MYYDGVITNANSLRVLTEEWGYVLVDCEENIQLFYALTAYNKYGLHLQYFIDVNGNWAQGVTMRDARGKICYCVDSLGKDFAVENFRRATKEEVIKKVKLWTSTTK